MSWYYEDTYGEFTWVVVLKAAYERDETVCDCGEPDCEATDRGEGRE